MASRCQMPTHRSGSQVGIATTQLRQHREPPSITINKMTRICNIIIVENLEGLMSPQYHFKLKHEYNDALERVDRPSSENNTDDIAPLWPPRGDPMGLPFVAPQTCRENRRRFVRHLERKPHTVLHQRASKGDPMSWPLAASQRQIILS
jgi:hypothetical protein